MICVLFKNTYLDQGHEGNCLCFLLETFFFSLLSILYLTHLKLIWVYDVRKGSSSFFSPLQKSN